MEFVLDKKILTKETLEQLYDSNGIQLVGNYALDKLSKSINNSHLVISAWENNNLAGYCLIITDGVFFGRIQEILLEPNFKENTNIITDILLFAFENCPGLKTFHLNPGVLEKKTIYQFKHQAPSPKIRKLYWSIHEDEF